MGVFTDTCGFGKRKKSVCGQKIIKRKMVQDMVKKLKAEGKSVDLQAINKEVLGKVCRKRQTQK